MWLRWSSSWTEQPDATRKHTVMSKVSKNGKADEAPVPATIASDLHSLREKYNPTFLFDLWALWSLAAVLHVFTEFHNKGSVLLFPL